MSYFNLSHYQAQFCKYIATGAVANILGYGIYVLLTWIGIGPILGMSLVFTSACLASFLGNKNWTFDNKSQNRKVLPRYLVVQSIGYLTNLALLLMFYRHLGIHHQLVQLFAIPIVAIELFLLSKYFVFNSTSQAKRGVINKSAQPFPASAFSYLAAAEASHWWFQSRNQIIIWILRVNARCLRNFLEVGCGTGYVISEIAETFPEVRLEASEYFEDGLVFARQRIPSCTFKQLDATAMTEHNSYDCIGSFDVIEHIESDELVLSNFYRALHKSGLLLLTVPQHPWLWSAADDCAHHIRRYRCSDLLKKVRGAGFRVEYSTSFVSLLLPLMALQRISSRNKPYDPDYEFKLSPLLNKLLFLVMQFELALLKLGLRFPAGGSILLLARKP